VVAAFTPKANNSTNTNKQKGLTPMQIMETQTVGYGETGINDEESLRNEVCNFVSPRNDMCSLRLTSIHDIHSSWVYASPQPQNR
jgi:hypothetical protein